MPLLTPTPLQVELKTLQLTEPFRIAHGASTERTVVRVRQGQGIGEASFVPYYPESPDETVSWLRDDEEKRTSKASPKDEPSAPRAGSLALDVLNEDIRAKTAGKPLWQSLALPDPQGAAGCRSFSIPTDLKAFSEKVKEVNQQFRVLKLKLGSGNLDFDETLVAYAREAAPKAILMADVNGGWSPNNAAKMIRRITRWDLELVEQPIHHEGGSEGWRELRSAMTSRSIRLIADESAQTKADLAWLDGMVEGVNVKLLKCGGLKQAISMINAAHDRGLGVLVGCMIESSIGVTAAAHLAGLADWVDLDGHLYVANDDYEGLRFDEEGNLVMPTGAGIGATLVPLDEHER
jgi:L-alanine-DL-glutamate epimerase-like enolase superfamily enzyme